MKESVKTIKIDGMHCASCVARVERAVKAIPGVEQIAVQLIEGRAWVRLADQEGDSSIIPAIQALGFKARVDEGLVEDPDESRLAERKSAINLWVAGLAAIPLITHVMLSHLAGIHLAWPPALESLAQVLLLLPVLWAARAIFRAGIPGIIRPSRAGMDSLVSLGALAAIGYSLAAAVPVWLTREAWTQTGELPALYFESAAGLIFFILLGRRLEARAKKKTADALASLGRFMAKTAELILPDGQIKTVSAEALLPRDTILVKAGQRIPADGIILEGSSGIDESLITGESLPVEKGPRESVIGGSINGQGRLVVEVSATGEQSVLAGILRLVREAQGTKPPVQAYADKIAAIFVPLVMIIALLTGLTWVILGPDLVSAIEKLVAVLVIACPCALGLAVPAAVMVASGVGARQGMIVRDASAWEHTTKVDTLVLDKTGTLTEGRPDLAHEEFLADLDRQELFAEVAALELASNHPLAGAFVARAGAQALPEVSKTRVIPGMGVSGIVAGRQLLLGNEKILTYQPEIDGEKASAEKKNDSASQNLIDPNLKLAAEKFRKLGASLVWVRRDGVALAVFGLADRLRPEAREVIEGLKARGKRIVLASGDHERAVASVAEELGIADWRAGMLPEDKADLVEALQAGGAKVLMMGDGINDGPALAKALVGVAPGHGTDLAQSSGEVILPGGGIGSLTRFFALADRAMVTIRRNFFWAFAYNFLAIPIAAGVLVPLGGPALDPMLAGLAMSFSSLSVLANSLLLGRFGRKSGVSAGV